MNAATASCMVPQPGGHRHATTTVKMSTGYGSSILIIDDDAWFRLLVRALLKRTPYRIVEAKDGIEGIAMLRNTPVDLLMTDIVMPGQGGLATIDTARTAFPYMKIVAVSGVQDKEHFLRAAEMMGADATLEKPITRDILLGTFGRLTKS